MNSLNFPPPPQIFLDLGKFSFIITLIIASNYLFNYCLCLIRSVSSWRMPIIWICMMFSYPFFSVLKNSITSNFPYVYLLYCLFALLQYLICFLLLWLMNFTCYRGFNFILLSIILGLFIKMQRPLLTENKNKVFSKLDSASWTKYSSKE